VASEAKLWRATAILSLCYKHLRRFAAHKYMLRITESLRLREPRVSRGIHSRSREAFQALLPRRQPGHRRRSDAEKLWASEATGRGMAGDATVSGFGETADLPGVHRGGVWVSEASG